MTMAPLPAYRPPSCGLRSLAAMAVVMSLQACTRGMAERDVARADRPIEVPSEPVTDCPEFARWFTPSLDLFRSTVDVGDAHFRLEYRPVLCVICGERTDASFTTPGFVDEVAERAATEQYVLRMEGVEGPATIEQEVLDRCFEIVDGDTLRPAFVHEEPMPPSSHGRRQVLIAFDHMQDGSERTVVLGPTYLTAGDVLTFRFAPGLFARYQASTEAMLPQANAL